MQPLNDRYHLLRLLGRGGFGEVWDAVFVPNQARVAFKILYQGEPHRFWQEAAILANFRHANIVQFYEFGLFYLNPHQAHCAMALELVPGGTLTRALGGRPSAVRPAVATVRTLAAAMHYAHSQGVVHRDLKPDNILLGGDGQIPVPKITDFGIARVVQSPMQMTQPGTALGSVQYMAPEQLESQPEQIGPWTDVYGLGAILYQMLTGRPPIDGRSPLEVVRRLALEDPPPVEAFRADVPRRVRAVCQRCLEKPPARRFPTAEALAAELWQCERDLP